jgi:hypothetical protein
VFFANKSSSCISFITGEWGSESYTPSFSGGVKGGGGKGGLRRGIKLGLTKCDGGTGKTSGSITGLAEDGPFELTIGLGSLGVEIESPVGDPVGDIIESRGGGVPAGDPVGDIIESRGGGVPVGDPVGDIIESRGGILADIIII